jgi:hypothetical protein
MSFSEYEGLGLPPIEAALSGNRVIGYTGEAGKEYWRAPLFTEIINGDVLGFVARVHAEMQRISAEPAGADLESLAPAIAELADQYSLAREEASVMNFVARAAEMFAAVQPAQMPSAVG